MTAGRDRRPAARAVAAYEVWVRDHAVELFGFAWRLCGDREIAEDLVQETYYEAWKCQRRLRHVDRARAWLFQILRHRYGRWRRAERRGPLRISIDAAKIEIAGVAAEPEVGHDELQRALDRVDDRLKEPLLMVHVQGLTCQEAADCLDLPLGTVLSRMHRARRKLLEVMQAGDADAASRRAAPMPFRIGGEP